MYYSKKVIELIKNDLELRLKICLALKIGERAVQNGIDNRRDSMLKIQAVNVIKEYTGLPESEIFEHEKEKA